MKIVLAAALAILMAGCVGSQELCIGNDVSTDSPSPTPRQSRLVQDHEEQTPEEPIVVDFFSRDLTPLRTWHVEERDEPPHVFATEIAGHYDVDFENYEATRAIMEVASVSRTEMSVSPMGNDGVRLNAERRYITLSVKNATPDHILREIARLADMDIECREGPVYDFNFRTGE